MGYIASTNVAHFYYMKDFIKDEENNLSAIILDAEGDEIECKFNYDNCVEINTQELSYIILTLENLYDLIDLLECSEEYYNNNLK